jgi:regulator of protease activity HflC (stomatin/prohibitin superfamily)
MGPVIFLAILLIPFIGSSVYTIESGNVGVKKTLGTIAAEEVGPGFHVKLPFITNVFEYSAKEIDVHLTSTSKI